MAKIKNTMYTKLVSKDVDKPELLYISGENAKWYKSFKKSSAVSYLIRHMSALPFGFNRKDIQQLYL
jgi:hypothetical protein